MATHLVVVNVIQNFHCAKKCLFIVTNIGHNDILSVRYTVIVILNTFLKTTLIFVVHFTLKKNYQK